VLATIAADGRPQLSNVHSVFSGAVDEDEFIAQMIAAQRLVIRLHVEHVYGVVLDSPPGG
jgi:hypothetical protein